MAVDHIRVLVVDDEPMVCAHLRTILGSAPDIEVVDTANDGAAAVESVVRNQPHVVLMDLRMPGVDGLTAIERIAGMDSPPTGTRCSPPPPRAGWSPPPPGSRPRGTGRWRWSRS